MFLDLASLSVILFFGVLGIFAGLVLQVIRLGALVAAFMLARPLGELFATDLAGSLDVPPMAGLLLAAALSWVVVYLVISLVGRIIVKAVRTNSTLRLGDSLGGMALGALKGAIFVYLALSLLLLGAQLLQGSSLAVDRISTDKSIALRVVRQTNLLARLQFPAIRKLAPLARAGRVAQQDQAPPPGDPALAKLLRNPRVQNAIADPAVQRAATESDWLRLLTHPKVIRMLEDPEVQASLESVDPAVIAEYADSGAKASAEPPQSAP